MTAAGASIAERAAAVVDACTVAPFRGKVWRSHGRTWAGDDAGGSLRTTGRFHRGADRFAADETWPALYTGLALHVALAERMRHTTPEALAASLGSLRISELAVSLSHVFFASSPGTEQQPDALELLLDDLCQPAQYDLTHAIAAEARGRGAQGLVMPTCTKFPEGNLVVFTDRLGPSDGISVVRITDPDLYIDWERLR